MSPPPRSGRFDRTLVEGPILKAVWKLAWPTMLQNILAGLQGIVDHAMVGHFVGYTANAAVGVSWQVFIVVIVFISSLFSGMAVLVARFAGSNEPDRVNRVVHQTFLTSLFLAGGVMAPFGYIFAPLLLQVINAAPEVRMEALPYLRILFTFSIGLLLFFMIAGALRSAGDARTPLRLGVSMTVLNLIFNAILIPGLGPIPAFGTRGAAIGTVLATGLVGLLAMVELYSGRRVIHLSRAMPLRPDWAVIRSLFRFGLPTGLQGVAMNLAGVLMLGFVGSLEASAEAQAAYAICYTQLFSLITWTSVGLMGAAAALAGQNLGAGRPDRSIQAVRASSRLGLLVSAVVGLLFVTIPERLLGVFGMTDPTVLILGRQLLGYLSVSGFFITVALTYTGGLQGSGDTRSPLYISIVSQVVVPVGMCTAIQASRALQPGDIWLAIVLGHLVRCGLSVARFRQQKWRDIQVDLDRPAGKTAAVQPASTASGAVAEQSEFP